MGVIAPRYVYLDDNAITTHLTQFSQKIGAIDTRWGTRFSLGLARRVSERFGKRFANRLGLPWDTVADAWFFPIWAELCTLVPARHLARRLARTSAGKPVLIPLRSDVARYLPYWDANELLPFYVAATLQRLGTPVAFICTGEEQLRAARTAGSISLRFEPHEAWASHVAFDPDRTPQRRQFLVTAGIRGVNHILPGLTARTNIECSFAVAGALPPFDSTIADPHYSATGMKIKVQAPRPSARLPLPAAYLSGTMPHADLAEWLVAAIGKKTKAAAIRAAELVSRHKYPEAHVCDHLFFELAIITHAVRAVGGQVVVWPHSSNAVHVEARRAGSIDRINCITHSAAKKWKSRFPDVPCEIHSQLMLRPCAGPRPLMPSSPLTIVIIAGSHSLGRLPVLDQKQHAESYRQLFAGLGDPSCKMRAILKPKPPWESSEWLRGIAGPFGAIEETTEPLNRIEAANLLYLSVSFGSTGLLEGLGRGIPCMIVRDFPVEDYTALDRDNFPIGSAEFILSELRRCRDDFAYLEALTERQLEWYKNETDFSRGTDLAR